MHGIMRVWWLLDGIQVLHIFGKNDTGDRTLGFSDAHCTVNQVAYLYRIHSCVDILACDIFEQRLEVNLLLVVAANGRARRLANNRHNGLMIHFGIVQTIEQVNCARSRGRQADTDLSCKLGVSGCHERCHLFMAHLHKLEQVFIALQAAQDAVNAVARIAIDAFNTPRRKAFQQKITDFITHESHSFPILCGCDQSYPNTSLNFSTSAVILKILTESTMSLTNSAV